MRILVLILGLIVATSAFAQDAVVTTEAPIYVRPDSAKPIRTAAVGTVLRIVSEDRDWVQVQFNDPQWGLRTGWVRATLLDMPRSETTPMDLSIRNTGMAPSPAMPLAPQPTFVPRSRAIEQSDLRVHTVGRAGATFGTATAALAGRRGERRRAAGAPGVRQLRLASGPDPEGYRQRVLASWRRSGCRARFEGSDLRGDGRRKGHRPGWCRASVRPRRLRHLT